MNLNFSINNPIGRCLKVSPTKLNHLREPFQYHALGVKPFRIPSPDKYTIQKVKPIQTTTLPPAHNKQPPSITQFMLKNPGENSEKYQQAPSNSQFFI